MTVGGQFAQEHRRQHFSFLDGQRHLQEILPMGLEQIPIDHVVAKEGIDMLVDDFFRGAIELEVFPVANTWQKLNAQQKR